MISHSDNGIFYMLETEKNMDFDEFLFLEKLVPLVFPNSQKRKILFELNSQFYLIGLGNETSDCAIWRFIVNEKVNPQLYDINRYNAVIMKEIGKGNLDDFQQLLDEQYNVIYDSNVCNFYLERNLCLYIGENNKKVFSEVKVICNFEHQEEWEYLIKKYFN